jgi:CRP-like cAMP-binding protein
MATVSDLRAIFADITPEAARFLRDAFRPVAYAAGETIFTQSDDGDFLLIVSTGRVRLSLVSEDGRELNLRHAVSGHVLGEIAALDGGPRSATAVAMEPVTAMKLARNDLRALLRNHPALAERFVHWLCGRLRETTEQLEAIALHPLEVRLARFLMFALQGRKAPEGRRVPLELGFSQGELAQFVGGSRSKVNGALGLLENAGAIKRTADRLFCDPDRLAEIAGTEP